MKLIQKDEYMGGEFVSDVFRQTSIGAIVAGMVNNDDEVLTNCDCEVQTINGMIGSTLELVADAVENGDKVDEHRAGNVADRLRLMASLSRFCSEAMTMIQDAQYRATVSATEAAKKSAQDASQKMGGAMTLIKKVFYRLFGAPVEVRIEEPKEELFLAVPTVWRNAR